MRSTQFVPKYDPSTIELAAAIEKGLTVLLATDTTWEIVSNAFNKDAYDRLFTIKTKPQDDPLILLVRDIKMLKHFVADIHPRIETLLVYHNRPLTIVYYSPRNLPRYLLAQDGSIAIRLVKDGICKEIMEHTKVPLVTTSANISGKKAAIKLQEMPDALLGSVDIVIDNNTELPKEPQASVIAKFDEKGELEILRD